MIRLDTLRLQLGSVLLCAALLHSCDGGGDGGGIGGSGITPIVNADLSYGTITGFGSVIINGQRYNTDQSEFVIDGETGNQSDLALGMLVSANVDFDRMSASQVSYEPSVLGPVASIDPVANRMTVLGQMIIVSADTVLDGVSLAGLNPGNFIQLTGNRDAAGALRATWIAPAPLTDQVKVIGNLANLQTDEGRFSIGQLSIDHNAANLSGLDVDLANGLSVIVSAPTSSLDAPASTLKAATIDLATLALLDSGQRIEIEGIVSDVVSDNRFSLDGRTVLTDANTLFQLVGGSPATAAAINRNTRVELEGSVDSSGAIRTTRITVIPSDESRLIGRIESLDAGNQSLRVLGIDFGTTTRTRYDNDESGSGAAEFTSLGVGSYVRIDASFIENTLVASRIRVEQPDEEARLRGPVTRLDVNASVLEVLGVSLIDGGDTGYENLAGQELGRAGFLQSLRIGDLVEARWKEYQSTALPPDDVEIED